MDSRTQQSASYMNTLKMDKDIIRRFLNGEIVCSKDGKVYSLSKEQQDVVYFLEEWNCTVWHVISHTATDADGNKLDIDCYLLCGNDYYNHFEKYDMNESEDTYMISVYSHCKNISAYSEFTQALIKNNNGCLERIY